MSFLRAPSKFTTGLFLFLLGFSTFLQAQPWAQGHDRAANTPLALPAGFEKYAGSPGIDYVSRSLGYSVYLSSGEVTLYLNGRDASPETVRIRFMGAGRHSQPSAEEPLPGVIHYYLGDDPKLWRTDVQRFHRIRYADVYPGIGLVFYCEQQRDGHQQLEFDFDVAPGSDVSTISMQFEGATPHEVNGNMELVTPSGRVLVLKKPQLYQVRQGKREPVSGNYIRGEGNSVGISVPVYDRSLPLIIDPALAYSTFIQDLLELTLFPGQFPPGSEDLEIDQVSGMMADKSGALYLTGFAFANDPSQGFPPPAPASQRFIFNAFVIKLDPTGSHPLYTAYIGGNASGLTKTEGKALTLDGAGNAYIVGLTNSPTFVTTTGAFNRVPACPAETISNIHCEEPFIAKFDPTGHLIFSTYMVKGLADDTAGPALGSQSIAVDASGAVYVGGLINPAFIVFPQDPSPARVAGLTTTPGAFQPTRKNNTTSYVLKMHPDGSTLDYSTYLGGTGNDFVISTAVDSQGVAEVVGESHSADFPTTPDGFQTSNTGVSGFYTKLKPDGSGLVYSTFLGAAGINSDADFIALDGSNNAYMTGFTSGPGFPTTPGVFKTDVTGTAGFNFVTEFDPLGKLVFSTYIGEALDTAGIAVDSTGVYVAGFTSSTNYPLLNSMQPASAIISGFPETFVTKLDPTGSALQYSTLASDGGTIGMSIDGQQNVYLAGQTGDSAFPSTLGAFQFVPRGGVGIDLLGDGFAMKIAPSLGAAVPVLGPRRLVFPDVLQQGVQSAPLTVLVSNFGDADLAFGNIALSGANAGDFSQSNNCGATIPAGQNCSVTLTFTPSVGEGVRTATLTVSFGGNFAAQTVFITGKAGTPRFQITPVPGDFGTIGDTQVSAQSFRITNVGTAPLTPKSVVVTPSGSGAAFTLLPPFLQTLLPGVSSIPFEIIMRVPPGGGNVSGQLIVTDNSPGSPHVFNLTGFGFPTGPDFAMSTPNGTPESITITAGQTATYDVIVATLPTFENLITFSCTGAPAGAKCSTSPSSLQTTPESFGQGFPPPPHLTITVSTISGAASLHRQGLSTWWAVAGLAALVYIRPRKRHSNGLLRMTFLVGIFGALIACGGGGTTGGGPPTPAGTYTLTVTGTSGTVTHSVPLTLIVK